MTQCVHPGLVPKRVLYTGGEVPAIGIGTFGSDRFSAEQVAAAVSGAIRAGYRLFDCAQVYGNETLIGDVFAKAIADGAVARQELFIMSKVWNDKHDDALGACKQSLRDLRLDALDAYFVHWPFPNYHAPGCDGDSRNPDSVPFSAERFMNTWRQMERLHEMGLARHIGMSNMTISKLDAVLPACRVKPAMIEMEMHPSFQQQALFDYCTTQNILSVGFCPIGSPTRPDRDKAPDDVVDIEMPEIVRIAEAHGVHPAVVCIKWAVQRGQMPIPFSVVEAQYVENLRCTTEDPLTDDEMRAIAAADRNCRLIKGQVFLWEGAKDWQDLWD